MLVERPGAHLDHPTVETRFGRAHVEDFAFDTQFFHLDEEAARSSIFGGLVASGWLTAALTMRLLTEREAKPAGGSVGLGFEELRWPIPVRPGDELRIESEILDVRPSKSRADRGVVKMRTRTFNQHGQVVQEIVNIALVPRRPPAGNDKADTARSTPERRAV